MVIEIKIKLNQINKTIKWLASETGLSVTAISYIINGRREPKKDTLESIADALNTSVRRFNSENERQVKEVTVFQYKKVIVHREQLTYRLQSN